MPGIYASAAAAAAYSIVEDPSMDLHVSSRMPMYGARKRHVVTVDVSSPALAEIPLPVVPRRRTVAYHEQEEPMPPVCEDVPTLPAEPEELAMEVVPQNDMMLPDYALPPPPPVTSHVLETKEWYARLGATTGERTLDVLHHSHCPAPPAAFAQLPEWCARCAAWWCSLAHAYRVLAQPPAQRRFTWNPYQPFCSADMLVPALTAAVSAVDVASIVHSAADAVPSVGQAPLPDCEPVPPPPPRVTFPVPPPPRWEATMPELARIMNAKAARRFFAKHLERWHGLASAWVARDGTAVSPPARRADGDDRAWSGECLWWWTYVSSTFPFS